MRAMISVRDLLATLSLDVQTQILTGNQLRQDFEKWLSPPDPFINFNTADHARHKGTAEWFTQSSVFKSWKVSSSLLWIHGKRTHSRLSVHFPLLTDLRIHSRLWKKCTYVRPSVSSVCPDSRPMLSTIDQLCNHPRYQHRP